MTESFSLLSALPVILMRDALSSPLAMAKAEDDIYRVSPLIVIYRRGHQSAGMRGRLLRHTVSLIMLLRLFSHYRADADGNEQGRRARRLFHRRRAHDDMAMFISGTAKCYGRAHVIAACRRRRRDIASTSARLRSLTPHGQSVGRSAIHDFSSTATARARYYQDKPPQNITYDDGHRATFRRHARSAGELLYIRRIAAATTRGLAASLKAMRACGAGRYAPPCRHH